MTAPPLPRGGGTKNYTGIVFPVFFEKKDHDTQIEIGRIQAVFTEDKPQDP